MTTVTQSLIVASSAAAGLDVALVGAIVRVESGGDRFAYRPEPRYPYFWDVKAERPFRVLSPDEVGSKVAPVDFHSLAGSREQEWWSQQASWGLMQIIGAVAREHGFAGPYLAELTDPAQNLIVGCRVLRGLMQWANGNVSQAAAAYNAGRGGWKFEAGRAYSVKVLAAIADIRGGR